MVGDGQGDAMRFLTGLVSGLGVTYLLDPQHGRRRRALIRDRAHRMEHRARNLFESGKDDLAHRAQGLRAKMRHPVKQMRRSGRMPELLQETWTPGLRLVAGAAGGVLL